MASFSTMSRSAALLSRMQPMARSFNHVLTEWVTTSLESWIGRSTEDRGLEFVLLILHQNGLSFCQFKRKVHRIMLVVCTSFHAEQNGLLSFCRIHTSQACSPFAIDFLLVIRLKIFAGKVMNLDIWKQKISFIWWKSRTRTENTTQI